MKRFIIILLLSFIICVPAVASDTFMLKLAGYPVIVDGKEIQSDLPVLNYPEKGATYVPLRAVLEAMDAKVEFKDGKAIISSHKEGTVADVAKQAVNCVYIAAYDYEKGAESRGSGVLLPNGYILTARHVMDFGKGDYGVSYGDYPGMEEVITKERLKLDTTLDIGLIRSPKDLQSTIILGDSDKCKVGDKIVVISSPHGDKNEVSTGSITKLDNLFGFNNIQIDAKTAPGSSGGALFNMNGELIGMIYGGKDDYFNGAIAINDIKKVLENVK